MLNYYYIDIMKNYKNYMFLINIKEKETLYST